MSGRLIVLEGIDGAGTTTQAERLVKGLAAREPPTHLTREPSDGPVGRLLRQILAGEHAPTDATTLSLMFAADRADHLQREVEPRLAAGAVVISDRWYHSSLAYQGTGEERAWIRELNKRARRPDLTILLRVDPEVAARRVQVRDGEQELFDALEIQKQVAAGYDAVVAALADEEHIAIVDGEQSIDAISAEILKLVQETCAGPASGPRSLG